MADKCNFCEERKPTNHLVLNGGNLWIEFCEDCGKKETLTNANTNETLTIQEIYEQANNKNNGKETNKKDNT